MDTSPKYIKMCEKVPFQKKHMNPSIILFLGNGVVLDELGDYYVSCDTVRGVFTLKSWLPRQDQLQEMVELTGYHFTFSENITEGKPKGILWQGRRCIEQWYVEGYLMEQLWLAFVMKEKYNKIWSPEKEKWVDG